MDFLVIRKLPAAAEDGHAETLRRLWPLLPEITIVEYKSPGRPYRAGDLDRLWSYAHAYHADPSKRTARRADLCAVLAVPRRTPSLDGDVASMGPLWWQDLGGGYLRVIGGLFALYVVELGEVAETEADHVLGSLGDGRFDSREACRFWMEIVGSQEAGMSMQDLEGYDELMEKLLAKLPAEEVLSHYPPEERLAGLAPEERLAGLAPEERLAGIAPEQRLAGLDHDHQALALPIDVLRVLPESYLGSLSPDVQEEIRKRIRRTGD
jgi:hypothetical protein